MRFITFPPIIPIIKNCNYIQNYTICKESSLMKDCHIITKIVISNVCEKSN